MKSLLYLTAAIFSASVCNAQSTTIFIDSLITTTLPTDTSVALQLPETDADTMENAAYYTGKVGKSPEVTGPKKDVKQAKNVKVPTFSKVYRVPGKSAMDIYNLAISFAQQRGLVYETNPGNMTVRMNIPIIYLGTGSGCIPTLDMSGTLKIQAKDSKTRVLIDNITYNAYNAKTNSENNIIKQTAMKSDKEPCIPENGDIKDIYSCTDCKQSLYLISSDLENELERYALQYISFLETN